VVNIGQEGEQGMTEDRRSAWLDAVALVEADLHDDHEATAAILESTTESTTDPAAGPALRASEGPSRASPVRAPANAMAMSPHPCTLDGWSTVGEPRLP
jgi:hypothetical protein